MIESVRSEPGLAYRHVLVPLDGSKFAARALPTAWVLAARFGAAIHAVVVAGSDDDVDWLREYAARALGTGFHDQRVHVEASDDVVSVIHRQVDELDSCLVCMSTHGRGRMGGAVIGSVARAVVERGQKPVVAVGPHVPRADPGDDTAAAPLQVGHLLACVDGTPESERVLPVAAAWADALDMRLTIVTVAEPCPRPVREGAPWRRAHGPDGDADEYVRQLGERWAPVLPGVRTQVVYDPIGPAEGITDYLSTHPTGLIVVASHLRSGLDRVVFGATGADIVRASTVPALIVPLT